MGDFDIEKLLKQISELEAELKTAKKYGLVWDKEHTKEEVVKRCETDIPVLINEASKKIVLGQGNNLLIEGDNYHVLTSLTFVLEGTINIIYIDPPYNTGNKDFVYNDAFIGEDDGYRHSKWLSFLEKRLILAKRLLTDDGVIFISIDEHEYAQLKLLCDKVFGESNYIENFVWIKNATKNLSKTTSTNHEYVLCYCKNISHFINSGDKFRTKKEGLDEVNHLIDTCKKAGISPKETEKRLNELYKTDEKFKSLLLYKYVDNDYRIYTSDNPSAPVAKGTSKNNFDIIHPITGKPCKKTNRGWGFSYEKSLELIKNGMLLFGEDETRIPRLKRFLDTVQSEVQKSYIVDNTDGKKEVQKIFESNDIFQNPKPTTLIKWLIKSFPNNSTILDFFAGSGTTGHAVIDLNKEDGGNRRFILCTNNENNICEEVTYPRLKTVITGKRQNGSIYSEGVPTNLYYFKTDFIKDEANTEQAKYNLVEKVDALLCIAENIFDEKERNDYSSHFVSGDKHLFIYNDYYNVQRFNEFKNMVLSAEGEKIVYVYSSDNNVDESLIEGNNIVLKPIPSKIYEIYKEIVEDIKRDE